MVHVTPRLTTMQQEHARAQLLSTALFSALEKNAVDSIVERMSLVNLGDAEILFYQQQPAEHVYLLSTGQIKLSLSASNGMEKVIGLVSPGSTFAEAVLFTRARRYPVYATSIGDSSVWAIDGAHYLDVLHRSVDACFSVIRCVTERLHHHVNEIERLTLHTATFRLITHLLSTVEPSQLDSHKPVTVRLSAPKNVIASRLSIVPSTFSRSLSKLTREGLIRVHDERIELLDIPRMRDFADEIVV